jgi:FG-GAP-like repeat
MYLGRGDGTFAQGIDDTIATTNANVNSVALGDLNGDWRLDLVADTSDALGNRTVVVALGLGDGRIYRGIATRHVLTIDRRPL